MSRSAELASRHLDYLQASQVLLVVRLVLLVFVVGHCTMGYTRQ